MSLSTPLMFPARCIRMLLFDLRPCRSARVAVCETEGEGAYSRQHRDRTDQLAPSSMLLRCQVLQDFTISRQIGSGTGRYQGGP